MPFLVTIDNASEHPIIYLKDTTTNCEAEIFAFGGLLNAFIVSTKQGAINIVDGFEDMEDAINNITNGFKSAKLSPFVCRMNNGTYTLNENIYHTHKHFMGKHAIHGLVYDSAYSVAAHEANDLFALVSLVYSYNGRDKGYPFNYTITVDWKLEANNKLTVTTLVENNGSQAIPMADGWHPYFRIGGSVDEWTLQFSNATQLVYDNDLLPTGKKINDERFANGVLLKGIELDNGFEFDNKEGQNFCALSNNTLRLLIEPDKSYPVLQIYIPPHRKSIAIENLSGAPDNFNNGMGLIMLQPNGKLVFTTAYRVEELIV